jgi:prepilin peptidase CpaA
LIIVGLSDWALYLSDVILIILIFVCAYTDKKNRKIYNDITLPSILLGLLLGISIQFPGIFLNRLLGFGVGFGLFFLMFMFGFMGGGDVKLVAAIGALRGYPFIVDAIFFGVLVGGLYAIVVLIAHKRLWKNLRSIFIFMYSLIIPWRKTHSLKSEESIKIPYGFCISIGTFIALILHYCSNVNSFFLNY